MFIVHRSQENPLLSPRRGQPWEALATFNPSAVVTSQGVRMYYRAISSPDALVSPYAGQSTIGTAESEDGVHFHTRQQVLMPAEPWDVHGCEDPRATILDGTTYVTYTALGGYPFNAGNIKVAIAISKDGTHFTERHLVTPFNAKAFALFPSKINGKYAALLTVHTDEPPAEICFVTADRIEDFWSSEFWNQWYAHWQDHALKLKRSDRDHVEVGASPILTERGWIFFYSYIENYFGGGQRVFSIEAALLDKNNPQQIIGRTYPFMVPETIYEQYGLAPNIVFPAGATLRGEHVDLWYGAADTACAKASIRLNDLLQALEPDVSAQAFVRVPENPILLPQGTGFESRGVFNAGVFELNDSIHLLYRAMDRR
jgi:beta-1,2-mannobiose phosphorylase / 1,2-beta-oligomannan phosphorylase